VGELGRDFALSLASDTLGRPACPQVRACTKFSRPVGRQHSAGRYANSRSNPLFIPKIVVVVITRGIWRVDDEHRNQFATRIIGNIPSTSDVRHENLS